MAERNDSRGIKDTTIDDGLDTVLDRALDDSTELKQDKPLETKDDSKDTNKEVEDMDKQTSQANSNTREVLELGRPNEELASLFQELAVGTRPHGSLEDSPPSMKFSMKLTFSRHTCFAFMREIVGRYSVWLDEQKDSISSERYDNYCKQLEVMMKFVEELDAVSESDSEEFKQRIQRIVDYMHQMPSWFEECPAELENVILEDILPSKKSIMQSFVSKDILYPSMKEFVGTYSVWLEEHKDNLSSNQYDNYCKPLDIARKVVEEFEAESECDSEEVKEQKLQRIVDYIDQMESFLSIDISYSYPSMKEFVGRISTWLEGHKDSLSSEQYDNYCKQLEDTRNVVEGFEAESESNSEELKQRLQSVVEYMRHMQLWAELIPRDSSADGVTTALPPGVAPN